MPRPRGRPKFEPTEQQRQQCAALIAFAIPEKQIAARFSITEKTLRKHFRSEIDNGLAEANAQVGATLFKMATSGKVVAATIFWAKTRMGYREIDRHEITGADGGPVDVRNIPDDQLTRLLSVHGAGAAAPPDAPADEDPAAAGRSDPGTAGGTGEAPDSPAGSDGEAPAGG